MKVLGIHLRSPSIRDLPVMVYVICLGIALTWAEMRFLDWDIAQANSALFGTVGFGAAAACGVDLKRQGLRAFVVTMLFVLALVGTSAALVSLIN